MFFAPALAVGLAVEGPGDQPALFLALRHGDDAHVGDPGFLQFGFDVRQVVGLGEQAGEPQAALGEVGALLNHGADEGALAAGAPQFAALAAEVEVRRAATLAGAGLAELVPFTLADDANIRRRGVEGRVAQGQVELLTRPQQAPEDVVGAGLVAQADGRAEAGIGEDDLLGVEQCRLVDVAADKVPAVFGMAEQRVHAVGADTDVEGVHLRAGRDDAAVVAGEQVGGGVDVVGAAGNRRAQVSAGQGPAMDAVVVQQDGPVKGFDGGRVGEVDARCASRSGDDEALEAGRGGQQGGKIVARGIAIAWMHGLSIL